MLQMVRIKHIIMLLSLILVFLIFKTAKTVPKMIQTQELANSGHPFLFFDEKDILELRIKADTTHKVIGDLIRIAGKNFKEDETLMVPEKHEVFEEKWNEVYGNNIATFAMYCLLNPDDDKAFQMVVEFMDRMASFPDWYVASSRNKDQVPIGHSLSGFATALDFLYNRFDDNRKQKYLDKMALVAEDMYKLMMYRTSGWPVEHIHNHAPTNIVAVLIAALVYEKHFPKIALPWRNKCVDLLEKGMLLQKMISDGTSSEGVAYGAYAARGFMQYFFLARKHLGIDHMGNPWLKQHFWFYFASVQPGFKATIGVADSNLNWFHGIECQLEFLDNYVMKNGYGNWLANKIRINRENNTAFKQAASHVYSTLHLEMVFYNPDIQPVKPVRPLNSPLHVYSDWGVVTYGAAQEAGATFFSFKSSTRGGEGVGDIIDYKLFSDFVIGWKNFNYGHEHPDQNSFVFSPNGNFFITYALYTHKFSYLNNVLMFSPTNDRTHCLYPWEGQMGECLKWLKYKYLPALRGSIPTVSQSGEMVHVAGEAAQQYRIDLGLKSVQRSLILLNPEVLVVVDNIFLEPESPLRSGSAYFNNILREFDFHRFNNFHGAKINFPDGDYSFFWTTEDGISPKATLQEEVLATESVPRTTHFVNVTFPLHKDKTTRVVYVFYGPNTAINSIRFDDASTNEVSLIWLEFNNQVHRIKLLSTNTDLSTRFKILGFGGFLEVQKDGKVHRFGMDDFNPPMHQHISPASNYVRSLVSTKLYHVAVDDRFNIIMLFYTFAVCYSIVFFIYIFKYGTISRLQRETRLAIILFFFVFFSLLWWSVGQNEYCEKRVVDYSSKPSSIFIFSLPNSGAELMEPLFRNSSDFIYFTSDEIHIPASQDNLLYNPCYWPVNSENEVHLATGGWFQTLTTEPLSFLNNLKDDNQASFRLKRLFREKFKKAKFAVNLLGGFWNTKISWIESNVREQMKSLLVVRDPRSWVYSLVREDLDLQQAKRQTKLRLQILKQNSLSCKGNTWLPYEYKQVDFDENQVLTLAKIWAANVASTIRTARSLQIVRFEDLVANPSHSANEIFRNLKTVVSVQQINKLERAVRSGITNFELEEPISEFTPEIWKNKMDRQDIKIVEDICYKVMEKLMYQRFI